MCAREGTADPQVTANSKLANSKSNLLHHTSLHPAEHAEKASKHPLIFLQSDFSSFWPPGTEPRGQWLLELYHCDLKWTPRRLCKMSAPILLCVCVCVIIIINQGRVE